MTFHGNLSAREKVTLAGSGCGVVTVVYKPVAFQDSAAVTFDHTWPGFMIIIPSGVAAFLALTDGIKNQELMFASAIYKCTLNCINAIQC